VKSSKGGTGSRRGFFCDGPVQGLEYETQTMSGVTNERGEFRYRGGETVTFSVGGLVLGSAPGSKHLTPAHLVIEVGGDVRKIKNGAVTNIARFLQSLDKDGNVENGITITDEIRNTVRRHRYGIRFDQSEEAFGENPAVKALCSELRITLRTGAQARNHLRRTLKGIRKQTDVRIPTRDGAYLLADVYRPLEAGTYPAIVNMGIYGKAFQRGCICNQKDLLEKEAMEDRYFEGNPDQFPWENHETVNTMDWVPKGYVAVKIDERGICNTPGTFEALSLQEAKDFYDAIEWTAAQAWSNGSVGTWGISYWAMAMLNMSQLQPPSLKAMAPLFTDSDSYRDYLYNGGIWNLFNRGGGGPPACIPRDTVDTLGIARAHPFYDRAVYGATGLIHISPDLDRVTVPFYTAIPLEHPGIHIRGSSETYIRAASKHKKLDIISGDIGGYPYTSEATAQYLAFFDYWLKGTQNGVMDGPPVRMMIRTGWRGYYWQTENEWPPTRTEYRRYYLDAAPSDWEGDGRRNDFMCMSPNVPGRETATTYSADVKVGEESPLPIPFAPRVGGDPGWSHGVSFITEPLVADLLIAGYLKLVIWVSSTTPDMDIVAGVRVMDENNKEIPYGLSHKYGYFNPLALGWLKVSHRKLDPGKSTVYRPYHTHTETDYQPMTPGEIVKTEVEIWPTTAFIRKGHRIRLDVQPADGFDHPIPHDYNETYHRGAYNTIYAGPDHPAYLQLPVIPLPEDDDQI
jgi:uncharacterized protein